MRIIVFKQESKKRLDKFLTEKLFYSRSFIQKIIKERGVLVKGEKVKPNYLLKENDEIEIDENKIKNFKKEKEADLSPAKKDLPSETPRSGNSPFWRVVSRGLEIIFEDENFLVVNKPAGLIVHPSPSHPKETLVNILINYFPRLKNVGENKLRPGIVHRLDKEASGLLIVAKTQKSFEYLKKQFQNRRIKKEYLVLVYGKVKDKKGVIELPIGRLPKKGFKMSAGYLPKSKEAITEYELIKYYDGYSLLNIKTKTGRTHQIRVHLKSLGYPVAGDKIYKPRKLKAAELGRIFLHCYKIGFLNQENKWREFKIDLPCELKNFLKTIDTP